MFDRTHFFDRPVKDKLRTYDIIQKIAADQGDDQATSCFLDYNYFKDYYKMIEIDLFKQQALDADPKVMQQINFTRHLNRNAAMFFIIEEAKETILYFSQETIRVLCVYLDLM